jgi:hypothetical protein
MSIDLRRIATLSAAFVVVAFTVILINQTAQVVELAQTADPRLGQAVLWGMVAAYTLFLVVPLVLFLRMPRQLIPPDREDCAEFQRHLTALRKRLACNPRLQGMPVGNRQEVDLALKRLDGEAEEVVRKQAAAVFLGTAVSQSGRLDALMVLAVQIRMVWLVSRVYAQRPSPRDMFHLYANVAGSAIVSGELDDVVIEPMVGPVITAAVGGIPGLQQVSSLLAKSALSGAANAFLTLRVGMITKRYCNALVRPERRLLKRSATIDATRLLGGIVTDGAKRIAQGLRQRAMGWVGIRAAAGKLAADEESAPKVVGANA